MGVTNPKKKRTSMPNVRERFSYSYRLLYEIGEGRIDILAVIHGKRLLDSLEKRF